MLADAPSETNTSEKPMQKAMDAMSTRRRAGTAATATAVPPPPVSPPVPRISSSERPEMYDRYPGMSGSTHGEMNESSPATKAATSVTFSSMSVPGLSRFYPIVPISDPEGLPIVHRFERNVSPLKRNPFHLHGVSLHRRQILEHEVPLPALGWIRRLQPAPRAYGPGKDHLFCLGVGRARHRGGKCPPDVVRRCVRQRHAQALRHRHQRLPVLDGLAGRGDHARGGLNVSLVVRIDRVLLHPCRSRQDEIRHARQLRQLHSLHDEHLRAARPARRDEPGEVTNRALPARVEHVYRLDAPRLDGGTQRRD